MDCISIESWLGLPTLDPVAVVSIAVAEVVVVDASMVDVCKSGVLVFNMSLVDVSTLVSVCSEPLVVATVVDSREDDSPRDVDPSLISDADSETASDDNDNELSGNLDGVNVVDNEIAASEVIADAVESDVDSSVVSSVDSSVGSSAGFDVVPDEASNSDDKAADGDNVVGDEISACEVTADVVVNDGNSSVPADLVSDDNDVVSGDPDDIDAEEVVYSVNTVDSEVDSIGTEVSDDVEVDTDESNLDAKLVPGEN